MCYFCLSTGCLHEVRSGLCQLPTSTTLVVQTVQWKQRGKCLCKRHAVHPVLNVCLKYQNKNEHECFHNVDVLAIFNIFSFCSCGNGRVRGFSKEFPNTSFPRAKVEESTSPTVTVTVRRLTAGMEDAHTHIHPAQAERTTRGTRVAGVSVALFCRLVCCVYPFSVFGRVI